MDDQSICLINDLGTEFLTQSLDIRVKDKLEELENLIVETNNNIINGKNSHFKFKDEDRKKGKWHLTYEGVEDKDVNNPIFKKIPKIDLADLVFFVNKKTKLVLELLAPMNMKDILD